MDLKLQEDLQIIETETKKADNNQSSAVQYDNSPM
jgi:hypothetical protein